MDHEQRIERAEVAYMKLTGRVALKGIRDAIAAYIGDDEVYVHDKEAGGSHIHPCCFVPLSKEESAKAESKAPQHLCGLAGFNPMLGDWCPAEHREVSLSEEESLVDTEEDR